MGSKAILADWDMVEGLKRAVGFVNRNLKEVPLDHFLRQTAFLGKEKFDKDTLWGQIVSLLSQYGKKPRVLREKIRRFLSEAEFETAPKLIPVEERDAAKVLEEVIQSAKEEGQALFGHR